MTPSSALTRRERILLGAGAALLAVAVLGPAVAADAVSLGAFADQRHWHGMANAMDVLSNLPFALLGLWGLWRLRRLESPQAGAEVPGSTLDCAWLFFAGLLATALGSAFYHLEPDAMRLLADRAGMSVAFAGVVGMAVCERVSPRAGWIAAWVTLIGGVLAVACSAEADNLLPWGVVQFGGMALVLVLALTPAVPGAIGLRLGALIAVYAVAKLFELGDGWLYTATGEFISGHTLKHLLAALAALPVLAALRRADQGALRHNPAATVAVA